MKIIETIKTFCNEQYYWQGSFWFPVLLWRSLLIIPELVARVLLVTIVFLGWGNEAAKDIWEGTE